MATKRDLSTLFVQKDPVVQQRLLDQVAEGTRTVAITPAELELREPPVWYLEKFVPEEGLTILYGPPKTGKTFLAMEWAFRLAYGLDWEGYHVDRGIKVLYCAAEGLGSLGERQKALRQARKWEQPDRLRWVTGSRHLYGKNGPSPQLQELYATIDSFKPAVVFLDTLARHSPGGNVSDNHDMQVVVDTLDQMRMAWGTTFVLIHHTRRSDNDFIGAQALFGSTDVMVELRQNGRTFSLNVHSRDWEEYRTPFDLQITTVEEDMAGWAVVENVGHRRATEGSRLDQVNQWRVENPKGTHSGAQQAVWGKPGSDVYAFWPKEEADKL